MKYICSVWMRPDHLSFFMCGFFVGRQWPPCTHWIRCGNAHHHPPLQGHLFYLMWFDTMFFIPKYINKYLITNIACISLIYNTGQLFRLRWNQGSHPSVPATVSFNFLYRESSYSSHFISFVRVNVTRVASDPQERITGTNPRELTCDCITGTTVYTTRGTDNHFWMLTMMEHHCPSQHLTPPRIPPGMNTHFSVNVTNSD